MINATFPAPSSMWISGTTQYALRAVLHVAEHGEVEPVRVDDIAAALRLPRNYLSKTLHALSRAGVLRSVRGPRGGFQLARDPSAVVLGEIAAPFDDLMSRQCLLGRSRCGERHPCSVHSRWAAISTALETFFRETTVADLLRGIADRPGVAPIHDVLSVPPTHGATGRTSRRRSRRSTP